MSSAATDGASQQQNHSPEDSLTDAQTTGVTPAASAAAAAERHSISASSAGASSSSSTAPSITTRSDLSTARARILALESHLSQLHSENAILRSTQSSSALSGSAGLSLAFKLLDTIKAERDALRKENGELRERVARGGGQTPLELLLSHDDLHPSTRNAVLALTPKLQETLASDLARWNMRAPTDAHGNPYDVNRRAMHIAKKLSTPPTSATAAPASAAPAQSHLQPTPSASSASGRTPSSLRSASSSPSLQPQSSALSSIPPAASTPLSPDEAAEDQDDAVAAAEPVVLKRKKLVVAGTPEAAAAALTSASAATAAAAASGSPLGEASGSDYYLSSIRPPVQPAETPLSTSLLSDTNRLIFQEDSPLYRQQLQLQRIRVAQLFARLDHLGDSTQAFASAAMAFATAAESLSAQLSKSWEDVETREVIDEAEAVRHAAAEARMREDARAREGEEKEKAQAQTPHGQGGKSGHSPSLSVQLPSPHASSLGSASSHPSGSQTTTHQHHAHMSISMPPSATHSALRPVAALGRGSLFATLPAPSKTVSPPAGSGTPAAGSGGVGASGSGIFASSSHHLPSSASTPTLESTHCTSSSSSSPDSSSSGGGGLHSDPLSLTFSMGRLAAMLSGLAGCARNLGEFLEHILVTSITALGEQYRAEAKQTMLHMERIMEEYEEKLLVYLRKKHRDRLKILGKLNIFGQKRVQDEEHMYICALRREMELRRLDHVEVLNTICTSRRLELVEVVASSFTAFVTFFHEGDFLASELKGDVEAIQAVALRRKRWYDGHFTEVRGLREQIKSSALPINLAKIFSSPPCLPIGMNATEWLQKITSPTTSSSSTLQHSPNDSSDSNPLSPPIGSPQTPAKGSPNPGPSGSPTSGSSATSDHDKSGGGSDIGHASLIYTIPGIGVAASLTKPAQAQGYLRTLSRDGKHWKRRWHVLEKGQFFYLRDGAFLAPRLIVNVLTCGARPCVKSDMDFVFELISPTRTMQYQAESEHEMKTWVAVFANSTEYLLSLQQTRNDTEALSKHMDIKTIQLQKHVKSGLLATLRKENPICAECGMKDPDWISINLGVMICIVCSGVHRNLGVHVSKVRSIVLDDLDTELLDMMVGLGNTRTNALWEGALPASYARPTSSSSREAKEEFIHSKYVRKLWIAQHVTEGAARMTREEKLKDFFLAAESNDLQALVVCLLQGCEVDARDVHDRQKTALHHAAQNDAILACEYLIQNGADSSLEDEDGRSSLDWAKQSDSRRVEKRLQGASKKH